MSQDGNEANKEKSNLVLNLVLGFIFSGMSVYVSPYIDPSPSLLPIAVKSRSVTTYNSLLCDVFVVFLYIFVHCKV